MIGDVTERETGELKPLGPILAKNPTGFPQPRSASKHKSLAAPSRGTSKQKPVEKSTPRPLQDVFVKQKASDEGDDFRRGNDLRVESMSASELAEAVDEISAVLSPKTIALLKEKSLKESEQQQRQSWDGSKSDGAVVAQGLGTRGLTGGLDNLRGKDAPGPPTYDIKTMPAHIASSLDELQSVKQRAPAYVKERLAWTESHKDDNDQGNGNNSSINSSINNIDKGLDAKQALARTMQSERFDLSGRKIVDVTSTAELLRHSLSVLGLSEDGQRNISNFILDSMLSTLGKVGDERAENEERGSSLDKVSFARDAAVVVAEDERTQGTTSTTGPGDISSTTSPQHPLLQHEKDSNSPGYTLTEAAELLRSQEPHQRAMALVIMEGALRRREAIASLETYDFPCMIKSLDIDGDNVEEESNGSDGEGPFGQPLGRFFRGLMKMTFAALQCEGYRFEADHHAGDKDSDDNTTRLIQRRDTADVRRILVYSLLLFVSSDFPTELPFTLYWLCSAQGQRHMNWIDRHRAFSALYAYMFSETEEATAEAMWQRQFRLYGCPALPQPHARRSEDSYESQLLDCFLEWQQLQNEETEAIRATLAKINSSTGEGEGNYGNEDSKYGQTPPPRPPLVAFALSCRWSRVNTLLKGLYIDETLFDSSSGADAGASMGARGRGTEPSLLASMASLLKIISRELFSTSFDTDVETETETRTSSLWMVLHQLSMNILWILQASSRNGDASTNEIIIRSAIQSLWQQVWAPLLRADVYTSLERGALLQEWQEQVLRLLCEVARKSASLCLWLMDSGFDVNTSSGGPMTNTRVELTSILSKLLLSSSSSISSSPSRERRLPRPRRWALRLWSVLTLYYCSRADESFPFSSGTGTGTKRLEDVKEEDSSGSDRQLSNPDSCLCLSEGAEALLQGYQMCATMLLTAGGGGVSAEEVEDWLWLCEAHAVVACHALHAALSPSQAQAQAQGIILGSSAQKLWLDVSIAVVRVLEGSVDRVCVEGGGPIGKERRGSVCSMALAHALSTVLYRGSGSGGSSDSGKDREKEITPMTLLEQATHLRCSTSGGFTALVARYFSLLSKEQREKSVLPEMLMLNEDLRVLLQRCASPFASNIDSGKPSFVTALLSSSRRLVSSFSFYCDTQETRLAASRLILVLYQHSLLSLTDPCLSSVLAPVPVTGTGTGRERTITSASVSVAAGVLAWHENRLRAACSLVNLSLFILSNNSSNGDGDGGEGGVSILAPLVESRVESILATLPSLMAYPALKLLQAVIYSRLLRADKEAGKGKDRDGDRDGAVKQRANQILQTLLTTDDGNSDKNAEEEEGEYGIKYASQMKQQRIQRKLSRIRAEMRQNRSYLVGAFLCEWVTNRSSGGDDDANNDNGNRNDDKAAASTGTGSVESTAAATWSTASAVSSSSKLLRELPFRTCWAVRLLGSLEGQAMTQWLCALSSSSSSPFYDDKQGNDDIVATNTATTADSLAQRTITKATVAAIELYYLLRLASIWGAHRWMDPLYALPGEDGPEEAAVASHLSLLVSATHRLVHATGASTGGSAGVISIPGSGDNHDNDDTNKDSTTPEISASASAVLAVVVSAESRTAQSSLSLAGDAEASAQALLGREGAGAGKHLRFKDTKVGADASNSTDSKGVGADTGTGTGVGRDTSMSDLTQSLLDAALTQQLHSSTHACVLTLLVCPLLVPVKVQVRVWRELASLRLVHLLEPEPEMEPSSSNGGGNGQSHASWQSLLPLFLPYPAALPSLSFPSSTISIYVSRAALAALGSLRLPQEDRLQKYCRLTLLVCVRGLLPQTTSRNSLTFSKEQTRAWHNITVIGDGDYDSNSYESRSHSSSDEGSVCLCRSLFLDLVEMAAFCHTLTPTHTHTDTLMDSRSAIETVLACACPEVEQKQERSERVVQAVRESVLGGAILLDAGASTSDSYGGVMHTGVVSTFAAFMDQKLR